MLKEINTIITGHLLSGLSVTLTLLKSDGCVQNHHSPISEMLRLWSQSTPVYHSALIICYESHYHAESNLVSG